MPRDDSVGCTQNSTPVFNSQSPVQSISLPILVVTKGIYFRVKQVPNDGNCSIISNVLDEDTNILVCVAGSVPNFDVSSKFDLVSLEAQIG